jgi:hypothetical protein
MSRYPRHTRWPVIVGGLTLVAGVLPFLGVPTPQALEGLYRQPTYRVVTGLVLAALVALQWSYVVLRRRPAADVKGLLVQHLWLGAAAPPLLLVHAISSGYGYQTALVWTFLANCALGLLSPRVAGRQLRGLERLWLPLHIAGSISVVALIAIHVVVVTRYH